jgi:lipopolysaccharide/colanic/teichoic acid biosynthesis glycosyltransferase
MMKRLFDLVASLCGLIVFSPLLVLVALWIKRDSPGPVFYRGKRAGRNGKPFYIFKFRSMVMNADKIGGPSTSGDDPRVTRSGRFIRRCKLDEITQLINVLRGDMSLVGPRPEVVDKVEQFDAEARRTLEIRPGITDWASIWNLDEGGVLAGAPDPDAAYEQVIRPNKLKLQLYYLDTRSFLGDIKIILYTALRMVRKNWVPKELRGYPTFDQMRAEVEAIIARQAASTAAKP